MQTLILISTTTVHRCEHNLFSFWNYLTDDTRQSVHAQLQTVGAVAFQCGAVSLSLLLDRLHRNDRLHRWLRDVAFVSAHNRSIGHDARSREALLIQRTPQNCDYDDATVSHLPAPVRFSAAAL